MVSSSWKDSLWKDDEELKADLEQYVRQNLKRSEILDFVKRDLPHLTGDFDNLE